MSDSTTVTIDRDTLKAIAVDTRMDVLQLLAVRPHTLSELSQSLHLTHATIKEHVDKLCSASLIEKEQSKRKWKYYSLTAKGQSIVNPEKRKALITFAFSLFAIAASGVTWMTQSFTHIPIEESFSAAPLSAKSLPAADLAYVGVTESAVSAQVAVTSAPALSYSPLLLISLLIFILGVLVAFFCLGYLSRPPKKIFLDSSK